MFSSKKGKNKDGQGSKKASDTTLSSTQSARSASNNDATLDLNEVPQTKPLSRLWSFSKPKKQKEHETSKERLPKSSVEESNESDRTDDASPPQAAQRDAVDYRGTVTHRSPRDIVDYSTLTRRSPRDIVDCRGTVAHRSPRDTVLERYITRNSVKNRATRDTSPTETFKQQVKPIVENESWSPTSEKLKKTTPTKSDSQYRILYLAICALITVIVTVLGTIAYYKNGMALLQTSNLHFGNFLPKTNMPPPQIDIAAIMDDLKRDFNEQPPMTFKIVKAAIQTLNRVNPKEPAIIALLTEKGAEDISSRFALQLTESVSKHSRVVIVSGHAFTDEEPDTAKKAIDDLLIGGLKEDIPGAVFVDRLDYIPGNAALIFHTYCGHKNVPFKRVVYVMTVVSNETNLKLVGQKEWNTKFQEHLFKSWSDVGVDQIYSLMSYLTVSVAAIVAKDES